MAALVLEIGFSLLAQERYEIPYDRLSEKQQKKVHRVMDDVTAEVPLESTRVQSRPEVYDFLLAELPFTSGVCRELGRSEYEVFRDPEVPEKDEAKKTWRDTYYLDDKEGLNLKVELVLSEPHRRIFYTWGSYDLGPLPKIWGRSVIVVVWEEKDGVLTTEARVFAQVHSAGYKAISGIVQGIIRDTVKEKSTVFIRAARWVAEAAAVDAQKLYDQVQGSKEVDPEVLEEFRAKFVK